MEIRDANGNIILTEDREQHPDKYFVVADSSYRYEEIRTITPVVLNFSLAYHIKLSVGCKINFENKEYYLFSLKHIHFTQNNERNYDFSVTFYDIGWHLTSHKFRNPVDGRLSFTLTAKPHEFLQAICDCLNQLGIAGGGWTVGECIESSEKTYSFSHNYMLDVLNQVADLFETEWELNGKVMSLKKVEYNKELKFNPSNPSYIPPNSLRYGKGNGFLPGTSQDAGSEDAVDVLWVEGGDRNIDQQTYVYDKSIEGQPQTLHANKLRLPRNEYCYYVPPTDPTKKGEVFLDSEVNQMAVDLGIGYADYVSTYLSNAVQFHTDADGFGIFRETYINNGYEDSLDLTEIYPHKVLKVASVELQGYTGDPATTKVDEITNRFWDIIATTDDDSAIPDYNDCLIGGQEVTIVFNTGMLAGKEFNLGEQSINGKVGCFDPATYKFLIQPAAIDGITMPDLPIKYDDGETYVQDKDGKSGTGYIPAVGDEFAVFHVSLPDQYIKEAEKELLLEGCHYLWQHSEVEVEFSGTVDPIWSVNKWNAISQYFVLGGYINFYDNDFCSDGKQLRILSIKTFLNNPHAPELTLSNSSVSQSISSELKKIPQNQVYTDYRVDNITSYARRSFRNAEETRDALQKWASETNNYFSNGISPITVQTMQLLVGDKSLQFEFGKATTDASDNVTAFDKQPWSPYWTEEGKLVCPLVFQDGTDVIMRHRYYTTENGNEGIVKEFTDAEFPYWQFAANTQHEFTPAHEQYPYYLYIYAPKTAVTQHIGKVVDYATFELVEINETAELPTDTPTHYCLLAGILNSEQNGTRSYTNVYGTVEITGGQIRLDTAISIDGDRYIDFINGLIKGDVNIVDGGVTKNFIFGSDFYHNYGGITGENVFYDEHVENFYGRPVRLWIGDGSQLTTIGNRQYLTNARIVFFADGSFLFKQQGKNFFRDVTRTWSLLANGSMRVTEHFESKKIWAGEYLEIGADNEDTTYFHGTDSHIVGEIRNRRDCASYSDRTINHYLGIVPTVMWHGFVWVQNQGVTLVNRFRATKSGGGYFDIKARYSNKTVMLTLPDDVNRDYLHFNAVKWHYWRSGQRQHGYYNFYEDDIYSINNVPSKGNNIMYVKYSWDGDDEEVPPFLLTIMYI